jgi:uncharacterized protein (DUF427 family)
MPVAAWNGARVAESGDTEVVGGNHLFPGEDVDRSLLEPSEPTSVCGWKGTASYYHVVDGEVNEDAAWTYREPEEEAKHIAGRVAFWNGVGVRDD